MRALLPLLLLVLALVAGAWWRQQVHAPAEAVTEPTGTRRPSAVEREDGRQPLDDPTLPQALGGQDLATSFNERALQALDHGDFAQAVALLREALEAEADSDLLRRNLARSELRWGRALQDQGRWAEAVTHFQVAVEVHSDQGRSEVGLADALLAVGRREQAGVVLAALLEGQPEQVDALKLAAQVAFLSGETRRAVDLLARAALLAPDDQALGSRLAVWRDEAELLEGAAQGRSARFDCFYDPGVPGLAAAIPSILQLLEDAATEVDQNLGLQPEDRLVVLLLNPEAYRQGAPNWSNGLYDGRIRVPLDRPDPDSAALAALFRHEYVHASLHRLGGGVPTWLHEGLAQWFEGRSVAAARAALREGRIPVPEATALQGRWASWTDPVQVRAAYAYALSWVQWWMDRGGPDAFRLWLQDLEGHSLEHATRGIYGMSLDQGEVEHRRSLSGG